MRFLRGRFLAASVVSLLAVAPASGDVFRMDSSGLSVEVEVRAAALAGAHYPLQRRQARALETARQVLGSPSSTLAADLRIARDASLALERFFTDATMRGLLDGFLDGGDALVRADRDALQALVAETSGDPAIDPAAEALDLANRMLGKADRARLPSRRARFLAMALGRLREGLAFLAARETDGALATASAIAEVSSFPYGAQGEPFEWLPDSVIATVTLDEAGNPASLRILMARTSAGAPLATLDLSVATGFTGEGAYSALALYDYDGDVSPDVTVGSAAGNLEVTEFHLDTRRIAGTFSPVFYGSPYRTVGKMTDGVFEIRGFTVE